MSVPGNDTDWTGPPSPPAPIPYAMHHLGIVASAPLSANHSKLHDWMLHAADMLDDGPMRDPRVAMQIAVMTPLAIVAMCLCIMVCRGVPMTLCGGRCTYWKRMPSVPKGTEPDTAIGEHQDEMADTDSVDEPTRVETDLPSADEESGSIVTSDTVMHVNESPNGHRECCSKMAAALENGALNGGSEQHTSAPSSEPSEKAKGKRVTRAKHVRLPSDDGIVE